MREDGGIITSWLLQVVVVLALFGVIAHDAIAILVTASSLDGAGLEVARAARDEYRSSGSIEDSTTAAELTAAVLDAEVDDLDVDGDGVVVELRRWAPTLVAHRIWPTRELVDVHTTTRLTPMS